MMSEPSCQSAPRAEPARHRFPRALRVTRHDDFDRTVRRGLRLADGRLTLWARPNHLSRVRLGLIVGRKHGNAVHRNRIKRLLREAFRLSQHALPTGMDLICTPRVGSELDLPGCQRSLTQLAARLAGRWRKRGGAVSPRTDA
jgi:ribonuclease P protein component